MEYNNEMNNGDNLELVLNEKELKEKYAYYRKVFCEWLNNTLLEENMTDAEKEIVKFYQVFLEREVPAKLIRNYMDHFRSYGIDNFIENSIPMTALLTNNNPDLIKMRALCLKKEDEKRKEANCRKRSK